MLFQETESTMDSPYTEDYYPSIKLFGKTLVLRDSKERSLEVVENFEPLLLAAVNKKSKNNNEHLVHKVQYNDFDLHIDNPLMERLEAVELQKEGSVSSATSRLTVAAISDNKKSDHSCLSNSGSSKCGKGFVPYKRCFAERDDKPSIPDREGQRARVCL